VVSQKGFSCSSVAGAVACVTFAPCFIAQPLAPGGDAVQLVAQVQEAESRRESAVHRIVSTRKYVLRNKRWDKDAVMHARVTWDTGAGKQFEVLEIENAEGLQKRVFQKLIEGEIEASRKSNENETDTAVTSKNYNFTLLGTEMLNERECLVVRLTPKRGSKYLIDGKAWIDPKEHAILRVEGRTAKSVSFWIGKPHIVQEFRKVGDVWVPASNRSASDVKLLGRTELSIDFVDYQVGRKHEVAQRTALSER
jgi:negative regulator of sigma E activity